MMTYLKHVGNKKHSDLKNKTFEEIQALYEKVKRFDESFTAVGSIEDERKIKEMNEGAKDLEQKRLKKKVAKETPKKEDITKVPAKVDVTEQGIKKRKGGHMKMLARKRKRPQSDVDSEHRKCLKIVTFEGKEISSSRSSRTSSTILNQDKPHSQRRFGINVEMLMQGSAKDSSTKDRNDLFDDLKSLTHQMNTKFVNNLPSRLGGVSASRQRRGYVTMQRRRTCCMAVKCPEPEKDGLSATSKTQSFARWSLKRKEMFESGDAPGRTFRLRCSRLEIDDNHDLPYHQYLLEQRSPKCSNMSRPPSQVLSSLRQVNAAFHQFEDIIKERTTKKPDYVSEWCFDYAKQFVEQQLVPFYDYFKKHIDAANDIFFKEIREFEQIFDELEAEYEQCVLDNKNLTIEKKNLLIKNDCLIAECLEKDICSIVLTS
ncbi:hypothetical protein Tco_0356609 [Tanacetum coccineum]